MNSDAQVEILPNEAEIIAKINELHAEIESQVSYAKIQATKAIELTVECGKLLIAQKKNAGHGKWEEWVNTNCEFNTVTAWRYMRLSQKIGIEEKSSNLSHIKDLNIGSPKTLRQAYIATGILTEAPKLAKTEVDDSTVSYIKHIDQIVHWYKDLIEQKPLRDWSLVERKAVINDLKPIVQIFNELSSKENV